MRWLPSKLLWARWGIISPVSYTLLCHETCQVAPLMVYVSNRRFKSNYVCCNPSFISFKANEVLQERDAALASLHQDMEALRRQMAADQQRAAETLTMELDRLDTEWASQAALRVRSWRM